MSLESAVGMAATSVAGVIVFVVFYKWSSRYYKKQREKEHENNNKNN